MANSTVHGTLIKYEKTGTSTNQITIYPKNTGQDVSITANPHASSATTVQALINALGALAFKDSVSTNNLTTANFASGVITQELNITAEGKIADARALKTLNDKIAANSNNITKLNSKTVEISILSSRWVGESAPYTYTISLSGQYTLSNSSKIDIGSKVGNTDEQLKALMACALCGGSINVSGNSITIKAFGEKPSIDIPISIIIREEI